MFVEVFNVDKSYGGYIKRCSPSVILVVDDGLTIFNREQAKGFGKDRDEQNVMK